MCWIGCIISNSELKVTVLRAVTRIQWKEDLRLGNKIFVRYCRRSELIGKAILTSSFSVKKSGSCPMCVREVRRKGKICGVTYNPNHIEKRGPR